MLDAKISKLKELFRISQIDDWCQVGPAEIESIDGIGPRTVDYLRILLAARGLTLRNDKTPAYWQSHLDAVQIGETLGFGEGEIDVHLITPFTILVDTAEQENHAYQFLGLKSDADQKHRPLIVRTERCELGRYPDSLGDYAISGMIGEAHVERKTASDYQSTVLGFKCGRRERFEQELANLARVKASMVVVEGSAAQAFDGSQWEKDMTKTLFRSTLALTQDYGVPIMFFENRGLAEAATFRFLERYWHKRQNELKQQRKLASSI